MMTTRNWLHDSVIYQIYPRSFRDANNDGVGDLSGIIDKLDYLNGRPDSLGITAIWLSPFYTSPMKDFGYDITDFCNVDPLFGGLNDFNRLVSEAHRRGIRVLIDFVPNHTSNEHPWFVGSRSSKSDLKRNWYVWRDPKQDGSPPNNWLSAFGGSAWELDQTTKQYYLHSFLTHQPDLNWDNLEVREAMHGVLRFWLNLGIDGFRVDAAYCISKDPEFRDDPLNRMYRPDRGDDPHRALVHRYSQHGPQLFNYLEGLAEVLKSYQDKFMIIEAYPDDPLTADQYYTKFYQLVDPSVGAPLNFEAFFTDWRAVDFENFITKFQNAMHPSYVPVYCFGNHDHSRIASRIGEAEARTAAVLLLTLPGMPVIYYGDELGMRDGSIRNDQVVDPFGRNRSQFDFGRDPERTPFPWNNGFQAGFTTASSSWLPVNKDYYEKNVISELADRSSSLQLYRSLLEFRLQSEALRYGEYRPLHIDNNDVFGYVRSTKDQEVTVLLNFSNLPQAVTRIVPCGKVVLSTHRSPAEFLRTLCLRPHEGLIILSD